jgi:pyruvate dehydrogenase E1 component alpha subunit
MISKSNDSPPPPHIAIDLYRMMLLIRRFEEIIIDVYPIQDMKTPVHLYIGQEAIATGVCANLTKEDYVFTTHRSHGHCLAKGVDPKVLYAEFYGRTTGCCKGKGGSMHPASAEYGIPGTTAIVGGGIPIAVGTSLASKMKGENRVSVAFFGDGATDEGVFHESLNFASLKKLPVIFVCENNFYSVNSPLSARQPHDNISRKAESYDIPGIQLDGNDVMAIYAAAKKAVQRVNNNEGPIFIECRTYRWKQHVGPDCDYEKGCRPKEELFGWMENCPIEKCKAILLEQKMIDETELLKIREKIDFDLESDLKYAKESPLPDAKELYNDVYFERKL